MRTFLRNDGEKKRMQEKRGESEEVIRNQEGWICDGEREAFFFLDHG